MIQFEQHWVQGRLISRILFLPIYRSSAHINFDQEDVPSPFGVATSCTPLPMAPSVWSLLIILFTLPENTTTSTYTIYSKTNPEKTPACIQYTGIQPAITSRIQYTGIQPAKTPARIQYTGIQPAKTPTRIQYAGIQTLKKHQHVCNIQ